MTRLTTTALFSAGLLWPSLAWAQDFDPADILTIEITAPLIETQWQESPSAVTLIGAETIQDGRAPLQPTDSLNLAPGVLVQNRNNFAQNPRVSIRGFGARAPFGIRGVRVQLDGVPLTTVDGQAQIDAIDPNAIETIEVLRGANAVLHGNGSGGLLDYRSLTSYQSDPFKLATQIGGHGLRRYHGSASLEEEALGLRASALHLKQDGYRQQSAVERSNVGLRLDYQNDDADWFAFINHLDNPLAQDPGALTEAERKRDPSQAAPLARRMNAGQNVTQTIATVGLEQQLERRDHSLGMQGWLIERDFKQQLPFPGDSLINYDRRIIGAALHYQRPFHQLTLHSQLSLEQQQDNRQRHCRNVSLTPFLCRAGSTTDLALDQRETASNIGLGLQLAAPVADDQGRWVIGLRNDQLRMEIDDKLRTGDIDNSGNHDYNQSHYSLGYSHTLNRDWSLFSQYATSFEAPTFTEFANPSGSGFRPGLVPQTSRSFEIGLRGELGSLRLETSLFAVRVRDEIIVDANSGAPPTDDRTFYRNADKTRRNGLELGAFWSPTALPRLELTGALTYMEANFDDGTGNKLPGLPDWTAHLDARYQFKQGYFAGLTTQFIGQRYADDNNTISVTSQTVTDFRVGRRLTSSSPFDAELSIGIDNLFNEDYLDNLRINARNGRYYEPGSERRLFVSLSLSLF